MAGTSTPLRRHGDEFERLPNGYYRALGRCDDTMNLGGIKVGFSQSSLKDILHLKENAMPATCSCLTRPSLGMGQWCHMISQPHHGHYASSKLVEQTAAL